MFDLFELGNEQEDIFPESWIGFEGKNLNSIIRRLIEEIKDSDKNLSFYSICRYTSSKTHLAVNAVWNYLNYKNYVLLPVLKELINLWKNKTNKSENEVSRLRKDILKNVNKLKINNSSSVNIKALKKLNNDLSFFVGAHAADGMINLHLTFFSSDKESLLKFKQWLENIISTKINSKIYFDNSKKTFNFGISVDDNTNLRLSNQLYKNLSILNRSIRVKRDYRWKLVDYYVNSIKILKNKTKELFGLNLKIKKEENAWKLETKNKILIRYLHVFFQCPYGKKSRIIDEPLMIKDSSLSNELAFLRGVFTFDGGVNRDGSIKLQIYSYKLFNSLKEILSKNNINFTSCRTKRGSFQIGSITKNKEKWLAVFEKNTEKWKKLDSFVYKNNKIKIKNEKDFIIGLSNIYPTSPRSKLGINQLFEISKTLNLFDLRKFSEYLLNKLNLRVTNYVILRNLEILEICNILIRKKEKSLFIRKKGKVAGTKGFVMKNVFEFNPNINKWRLPY